MQIIVISSNGSKHRQWQMTPARLLLAISFMLVLAAGIAHYFSQVGQSIMPAVQSPSQYSALPPSTIVAPTEQTAEQTLNAYYAKRLGKLQAESIRLAALTEKLAMMAGVDTSIFVLQEEPAQGGVETIGEAVSPADFQQEVAAISQQFAQQSQHLNSIQNFFITNDNIQAAIPQGRPITDSNGWLSSYYGNRIDPFTGKKTFHKGVDFAGKQGSDVIAVADGIITWTGKRSGYGQLVEIDHGNGYVTRYAHNKKLLVKVGDRVKKGQTVAAMGSTGRSTGPHVHFEVLRDGKAVNPYNFIKS